VLILMVLRQLLTLYQVGTLQRQLQVKNRSLSMLNTHLEQRAAMDALTGLPNHRTVVEKLDEALEHARTTGGSCAVVFMDVDSFKTINDRYGHLTGDTVLCNFATLVKSGLRAGDWVGRWGGEEFVAILPDTDPLEALNLAEGDRKRIERHVLAGNGEIHVTCSLGVASYPQDGSEREDLIMGADNAMYAAKRLGRNQTRAAHEPLVQTMSALEPTPATAEKEEMLVVVDAFLALLEARDPGTSQHVRRVATLALKLALALGLSGSEAHLVSLGGLLHDLGKVAVPDAILGKHAQLDKAEREAMIQHPLTGAALLQPIPVLRDVAPIVRAHHEQMDGSGYPDGLQGEEIPLGARIVAVADAYDAMTNERVYHSALPSAEALRILQRGAGSQFDPRVVEMLARLLVTTPSLSDVA
jgi:diguanylate cyclase (GGDEF)-like protein/putative nucleotidyltransferase with HDIG domain